MDQLFIDIESIPSQRSDVRDYYAVKIGADTQVKLAGVRAPANYKDESKITEYMAAATRALLDGEQAAIDAEIAKTGLDGSFGQIVCICWAWNDDPVNTAYADDLSLEAEHTVLEFFFAGLHSATPGRVRVVGHNVAAFDLRFVRQRAIVHALSLPLVLPVDPKPWDDSVYDTMLRWAGVGKTISMDRLCLALSIPGKGNISGADIWPMAQAGRFSEIAEYCRDDVERTRSIYQRLTLTRRQALVGAQSIELAALADRKFPRG